MISDEERRKVAEELRSESETWLDTFPSATVEEEAFGSAVLSDLMVFVGLDYESPVYAIYARLADLIERPTCNNVSEFGSHAVMRGDAFKDEEFDFVCSRCGINLMGDEMDSSPLLDGKLEHHALSFCPNCGAEVVE